MKQLNFGYEATEPWDLLVILMIEKKNVGTKCWVKHGDKFLIAEPFMRKTKTKMTDRKKKSFSIA